MIIEVSGPSGVGKTFLIKNIINSLPKDCLTGSIHSSKTNNCKFIPKYFSEVNSHNIVTDLYSLPWFLLFTIFNLEFVFFSVKNILFLDTKIGNKIAILRSFIRKAGIFRYLRKKKFNDFLIFVDEGLFHSAHNFLCSPNMCANQEKIASFFKLCPLPDKLIILNSSRENILRQLSKRGDFSPRVNSKESLINFIKNSHLLYSKLSELLCLTNSGISLDLDESDLSEALELSMNYIRKQ